MLKMKRRPDGRWQKKVKVEGVYRYFYSTEATQKKAEEDFNITITARNGSVFYIVENVKKERSIHKL